MAIGTVAINTEVASTVMTQITNACNTLESEVTPKLASSFQPLVDCGLVSTCISKLQEQVNALVSADKEIIASIASHIGNATNTEDNLYNGYDNSGYSGGGYSGGGSSGGGASGGEVEVQEEDDGKKVNKDELNQVIASLDKTTKSKLVTFFNIYKNKDTSLAELLLDNSKSEELFTLLKEAFKGTLDLSNITLDDIKEVRKVLLDAILKKDVNIPQLSGKTILAAKEYLIKVCSDNKINPSDLFFDDKYKDTLKLTIKNLYNGKTDNTTPYRVVLLYRDYIESVASKNNMTVDELIDKKPELVF